MKQIDVDSTLIHSIAYDETRRILDVTFQEGDRYRYYEVEAEVIEEFLDAESKGRYFNEFIRDAYLFTKLW